EDTPSKTDNPLTQIRNRKHHTGAKTIVGPRRMFTRHRQSGNGQITLSKTLFAQRLHEPIPLSWGTSDFKSIDRSSVNAPAGQVVPCRRTDHSIPQVLLEPRRDCTIELLKATGLRRLRPCVRSAVRHVDSKLLSKFTDRLGKVRAGDPHQKRKHVTARATSETMKDLAGRTDGEGGRFFLMKGTKTF